MSFIIKGIDLPKKAELFIEGEPTIVLAIRDDETVLKMEHHEWHYTDIEAIQIPKGARLIDANKLEIRRCDDSASRATFDYVDEWDLEDAPTILESEEE